METYEAENGRLKCTAVQEPVVIIHDYKFLISQLAAAESQLAIAQAEVDRHKNLISEAEKLGLGKS